jgi:hypothetical protein
MVSLIAATFVVMAAMGVLDQRLKTGAVPFGIVSFEIAGDVPTAQAIVDSWEMRAKGAAGVSLGLDYLFMALYSTSLAFACFWAARVLRERGWRLGVVGVPLGWGQWLAAVCDGFENFALIRMLLDGVREPWPALARGAATTKFALVATGLSYVIAAAGIRASNRS